MSCAFQFILYCGRFMLIVSSALVVFGTQKKAEVSIPYDPAPPGGPGRRPLTADQQGDSLSPSTSRPTPSPPAATAAVKKEDPKDSEDIVKRLQAICTDADPTRLYRSLVKINGGSSGDIYTACQVGTNLSVSIKLMDLAKQPSKDLLFNEILAMRGSRHPNIVDYIDSFLYRNDLWVVMEYMEGGMLLDVIMFANLMTEGQISAVSRETAQGE
jgi:p21-activated kinase 1